jgi:hypothetical protein
MFLAVKNKAAAIVTNKTNTTENIFFVCRVSKLVFSLLWILSGPKKKHVLRFGNNATIFGCVAF